MVISAGSCRTGEVEGVGTVELVCVDGLLRMVVNLFYSLCGGCWRWVYWQRGVGCLGSQDSDLAARKPPWDGSRMGDNYTKSVYPIHLVDGYSLMLGHGGAEEIVWCSNWKEKYVQG